MTMKQSILRELEGRGYDKYEDIPEELLDYLPDNIDDDDDDKTDYE